MLRTPSFAELAIRPATRLLVPLLLLVLAAVPAHAQGEWTIVAWNDLGMHCLDADFSKFAILPPYNTIHAQLLDATGQLVTNPAGITVTYEAVADPGGSINVTSAGKTNFWDHVLDLFGAGIGVDQGLAGYDMPGASNTPQPMGWDAAPAWFTAEGIPLTPRDDAAAYNTYPMMRIVARDGEGHLLAETRTVLPVSDEMDCSACHASGSSLAAQPAGGWVDDPDPQLDFRRNILRLHDELEASNPDYASALAANGFDAAGLEATADGGHAILCAACHTSNALPGLGLPELEPLTEAMHAGHATVVDPATGMTVGSSALRGACYRCHPGSTTRCLRGAMGKAVGVDGLPAMQCQSCHGDMAAVGDAGREGWLAEPSCQNCHTGTAIANAGQIRFTSAFVAPGVPRAPVDPTFATDADAPLPGFDLFRFSSGHGGLACESCHGSTHAIYPASHANDNVESQLLQGHAGTLVQCTACHDEVAPVAGGGPHGLHPVGQEWLSGHHDWLETHSSEPCRACHGADLRGTVLSASQRVWTATTDWGAKSFWRGFKIGCWACHDGPTSESPTADHAPVATPDARQASAGIPLAFDLVATDVDSDPLELRIVDQPAHGTVGLVGTLAIVYPDAGFDGDDGFTFAAWDGKLESNLATVTLDVVDQGGLFGDGFESGSTARWSNGGS